MRITVKENEGKEFSFLLPTSLIKSKLILKLINKYCDADSKIMIDILPKSYKELRRYIKKYGHFVLIDVISKDGDIISIKV